MELYIYSYEDGMLFSARGRKRASASARKRGRACARERPAAQAICRDDIDQTRVYFVAERMSSSSFPANHSLAVQVGRNEIQIFQRQADGYLSRLIRAAAMAQPATQGMVQDAVTAMETNVTRLTKDLESGCLQSKTPCLCVEEGISSVCS